MTKFKETVQSILNWFGLAGHEVVSLAVLGIGILCIFDAVSRRYPYGFQVEPGEIAFGVTLVSFGAFVLLKSVLGVSSPNHKTQVPKIAILAFASGALLSGMLMAVPITAQATILESVESALDDVESSVSEIESEVARFQVENWRDVVGDVVTSTDNVIAAVDHLGAALRRNF